MNPGVFTSPYPVLLDLVDVAVLVVGGGSIGAREAAGLVDAGARVTVVSPAAWPSVIANPDICWHERPYQRGEVASYRLAVAATGDAEVNRQVAHDANAAGIFVNSVDDARNCSFMSPTDSRSDDWTDHLGA